MNNPLTQAEREVARHNCFEEHLSLPADLALRLLDQVDALESTLTRENQASEFLRLTAECNRYRAALEKYADHMAWGGNVGNSLEMAKLYAKHCETDIIPLYTRPPAAADAEEVRLTAEIAQYIRDVGIIHEPSCMHYGKAACDCRLKDLVALYERLDNHRSGKEPNGK